jgi:hypothetical protein
MNCDAMGAVGQVLGSVAVFVTLVYRSILTQHARAETRRSIRAGRWAAVREMAMYRSGNERLGHIYSKAHQALDGQVLTPFIMQLMERAALTREEAGAVVWDQ